MKLTFTQKEYQRLLELIHLGMWVVTGYQGEETAAAKRYFALDQKLLQLAGPAANGVFLPTTFVADNPDPKVKSFVEGYRTRYGSEPSMFAAQAYDATNIMLNAIVAAGPNPTRQKVRDALAATRNFAGVTGDTTFDPKTREPSKTLTRMEIVDGKFKVLR